MVMAAVAAAAATVVAAAAATTVAAAAVAAPTVATDLLLRRHRPRRSGLSGTAGGEGDGALASAPLRLLAREAMQPRMRHLCRSLSSGVGHRPSEQRSERERAGESERE